MLTKDRQKDFEGRIRDWVQTYEEDLVTQDLCVNGTALLWEDLEADSVDILGKADVRGLVTCDRLSVDGRLECGYALIIGMGEVSGRLKVAGKINAEALRAYGRVSCRSSARIYDLDVTGEFSCTGKLRTESITVMGSLWVNGSVRTRKLSIDSAAASYADEILADSLIVNRSVLDKKEGDVPDYLLRVTEADCDKANLHFTKIRTLRCKKATIGPGCVIGEIYCKNEVTVSPQATVGRVVYV